MGTCTCVCVHPPPPTWPPMVPCAVHMWCMCTAHVVMVLWPGFCFPLFKYWCLLIGTRLFVKWLLLHVFWEGRSGREGEEGGEGVLLKLCADLVQVKRRNLPCLSPHTHPLLHSFARSQLNLIVSWRTHHTCSSGNCFHKHPAITALLDVFK